MTHLDEILRIKGKNLFDKDGESIQAYINTSGKIISNTAAFSSVVQCKPLTTYTLQFNNTGSIGPRLTIAVSSTIPQIGDTLEILVPNNSEAKNHIVTFTTASNTNYLFIWWAHNSDQTGIETLQLEEGSTATTYEPYTGEFKTIGDVWKRAIPTDSTKGATTVVNNSRKCVNLFDAVNSTRIYSSGATFNQGTGWLEITTPSAASHFGLFVIGNLKDFIGKTLTLSGNYPEAGANDFRLATCKSDGSNRLTYNTTITITDDGNDYLCIKFGAYSRLGTFKATDIMLVEGSTALPYYPYFSPTQVAPSIKCYGGAVQEIQPNGLWGRYVPVEYIENTDNSYIDTDVIGTTTSGLQVYVDVQGTSGLAGSNVLISANGGAGAGQWFGHNTSVWTSGSGAVSDVAYNTRIQTTVSFGKQVQYTLNGITYTRQGSITDTETTRLFMGIATSNNYYCRAKLFSSKIWNNGTLVRSYIPVKDTVNNVYGMWDRVNNKFYGNSGTGTFTAGGELQFASGVSSTPVPEGDGWQLVTWEA